MRRPRVALVIIMVAAAGGCRAAPATGPDPHRSALGRRHGDAHDRRPDFSDDQPDDDRPDDDRAGGCPVLVRPGTGGRTHASGQEGRAGRGRRWRASPRDARPGPARSVPASRPCARRRRSAGGSAHW